jgi:hypothetical protein
MRQFVDQVQKIMHIIWNVRTLGNIQSRIYDDVWELEVPQQAVTQPTQGGDTFGELDLSAMAIEVWIHGEANSPFTVGNTSLTLTADPDEYVYVHFNYDTQVANWAHASGVPSSDGADLFWPFFKYTKDSGVYRLARRPYWEGDIQLALPLRSP